ncbi:MAG: methyltransferase domain-containing protein [Chitinivibrionales bacterium]|nr:methyltransferase domain-containing protein [Chitinivibrionales bacterium]
MNKSGQSENYSAYDAKVEAQKIAFAPVVFQAARALRNTGILEYLNNMRREGSRGNEIAEACGVSPYGTTVLLESGMSAGIIKKKNGKFFLSPTGYCILKDEMTRVNMDFIHDVCYKGLFFLEDSIREQRPAGLQVFGDWKTIYQAVTSLPPDVQQSWYRFDHFYSDAAFVQAMPHVMKNGPGSLMDIGGNTGKWALMLAENYPDISITIVDLPQQLDRALAAAGEQGLDRRIRGHAMDLLDHTVPYPEGYDAIWMSQFLDCFSENDIVQLLKRAVTALSGKAELFILEPLWDRQAFDASSFCLVNTSLYFTCMANGSSRMYSSDVMHELIDRSGLIVNEEIDSIGLCHTLLRCTKKH